MKRLPLMLCSFLVALGLLLTPATASAQHYWVHLGQISPPTGPENYVFYPWYAYAAFPEDPPWIVKTMKWNADSDIWQYTNYAMAQWNSNRPPAIPAMVETGTPADADLLLTYVQNLSLCPDYPAAIGCWDVTTWQNILNLNANLWKKSTLQIKKQPNYSTDGIRGLIIHEIGHALGMADKYGAPGTGCNANWFGVMDAMTLYGNLIGPCDTVNPTANDFWIWRDYHITGHYWPDIWSQLGNGQVTMRWKDYAYQDWWMEAKWKWSSQPNGSYTEFTTTGTTLDNGTHQDAILYDYIRILSSAIPVNNGINYKWLKVCTKPVFNYLGDRGTEQCYGPVWYQHPR